MNIADFKTELARLIKRAQPQAYPPTTWPMNSLRPLKTCRAT
jgi:hypothetical protein